LAVVTLGVFLHSRITRLSRYRHSPGCFATRHAALLAPTRGGGCRLPRASRCDARGACGPCVSRGGGAATPERPAEGSARGRRCRPGLRTDGRSVCLGGLARGRRWVQFRAQRSRASAALASAACGTAAVGRAARGAVRPLCRGREAARGEVRCPAAVRELPGLPLARLRSMPRVPGQGQVWRAGDPEEALPRPPLPLQERGRPPVCALRPRARPPGAAGAGGSGGEGGGPPRPPSRGDQPRSDAGGACSGGVRQRRDRVAAAGGDWRLAVAQCGRLER